MKSKVLKIRNIPVIPLVLDSLKAKPTGWLLLALFSSAIIVIADRNYYIFGILIFAISLFALIVMPDRVLMQFTESYVILYNTKERDECKLVYWDEIISWQYVWRTTTDVMQIELVDGTMEKIECFNRNKVESYFKVYASGKQKKNIRKKKV